MLDRLLPVAKRAKDLIWDPTGTTYINLKDTATIFIHQIKLPDQFLWALRLAAEAIPLPKPESPRAFTRRRGLVVGYPYVVDDNTSKEIIGIFDAFALEYERTQEDELFLMKPKSRNLEYLELSVYELYPLTRFRENITLCSQDRRIIVDLGQIQQWRERTWEHFRIQGVATLITSPRSIPIFVPADAMDRGIEPAWWSVQACRKKFGWRLPLALYNHKESTG